MSTPEREARPDYDKLMLEQGARALYRAKYPDGLQWQELDDSTRDMWIVHTMNLKEHHEHD